MVVIGGIVDGLCSLPVVDERIQLFLSPSYSSPGYRNESPVPLA